MTETGGGEPNGNWHRRLDRFAEIDCLFQVAFILVVIVAAGVSMIRQSVRAIEERQLSARLAIMAANTPVAQLDTAVLVGKLAGCYDLRRPDRQIVVKLLSARSGPYWEARDAEHENRGGAWWSWAPVDSNHFYLDFGGIDGALQYEIELRRDGFAGIETFHSGNQGTKTTQPVRVRRVVCPQRSIDLKPRE